MNAEEREAILADVLGALDRGEAPDIDALLAAHPGEERAVRDLIAAAQMLARTDASRGQELEAGARLGDFEIEGPLAHGGMGTVFVARQRSLGGRRVALKVVDASGQDGSRRERLHREALLLAPLHHPHLSEVYGFGETSELVFIAMQLVEGHDLEALRHELRGTSARQVVEWIAQVASGLSLLHENGLVHRDVKPANIVLASGAASEHGDGKAVLVDFGLVRELDAAGVTTTANVATPGYAAPEQLLGLEVGPAADTFALGVTLYDVLSDQRPHERQHASAGLEPLDASSGINADLAALVAKATDPDPRWRYRDGAALHADLRKWLAGRTVSARHPPTLERVQRWIGSHPRALLGGAAAVPLMVLAVLGLLATGRSLGAAERARGALDRVDLVAFQEAVREVPQWLRGALLGAPHVVRAAHEVDAPAETGGIAAVAEHMRTGDVTGALLSAATELESAGYVDQPTLTRFLESALAARDADGRMSTQARHALGLVARLYYERPVTTSAGLEATEPIRTLLRELWAREALRHHERLLVLAGLAGCGATADVGWILEWGCGDRQDPEDARMSFVACEFIVRRAHRCGGLDSLDIDRAEELVLEPLRATYFELKTPEDYRRSSRLGIELGTRKVATALAYARKRVGGESAFLAFEPEDWSVPSYSDELMIALGHPGIRSWLEDPERRKSMGPSSVSWCCAVLDDPALTREIREHSLALAATESERQVLADVFDRSGHTAREIMQGIDKRAQPDADTLLTVHDAPEPARAIDFEQVEPWAEVAGALCAWNFRTEPPTRTGTALGASMRHASLAPDERQFPYLRFARFGVSEATFEFDVLEPCSGPVVLELVHLAAARGYYPYGGEAYLDVELDDKPIERILALNSNQHPARLELTPHLLQPGRHVLRIRGHVDTTTTYRLHALAIFVEE
ncbi:MAG: serine/threonine protein kinase [bacterium]|nr:serine/threonine protein kinase [bacterium]